jgi:hypothetical protein
VLTVAGNGTTFLVKTGGSATMIAGQKILYLPGTKVEPGGYMRGYISTNGQFCGGKEATIISTLNSGEGEAVKPAGSSALNFQLYPNPTSGIFTLEQKGDLLIRYVKTEIYALNGQKVRTAESLDERKQRFDISDLPVGVYFVKIVTGDYVETIKLVKTN